MRPQIPLLLARNTAVSFYPVQQNITGQMVFVSLFDASTNLFPAIGTLKNGVAKGNVYIASAPGQPGGQNVNSGAMIMALVDNPGQSATNWYFF